jgi:hypothetical protein
MVIETYSIVITERAAEDDFCEKIRRVVRSNPERDSFPPSLWIGRLPLHHRGYGSAVHVDISRRKRMYGSPSRWGLPGQCPIIHFLKNTAKL